MDLLVKRLFVLLFVSFMAISVQAQEACLDSLQACLNVCSDEDEACMVKCEEKFNCVETEEVEIEDPKEMEEPEEK